VGLARCHVFCFVIRAAKKCMFRDGTRPRHMQHDKHIFHMNVRVAWRARANVSIHASQSPCSVRLGRLQAMSQKRPLHPAMFQERLTCPQNCCSLESVCNYAYLKNHVWCKIVQRRCMCICSTSFSNHDTLYPTCT
jgi:hypothetical protein